MTQSHKTPPVPVEDVPLYTDPIHAGLPEYEESSLLDLVSQLPQWRFFILKVVVVFAVLSVIVALLWPKTFTATARIMPPQQGQSSLASAMMGQLGPLAALAGSALPTGKNASDVYLYVLRSRTIADDLIDQFSLMKVYKQKTRTFTEDKLRENTQLTSGKEGGITISVDDRDPNRAAELANGYVDDLKKLTKTLAMTEAGRRRIFFENEVQKAMDDLSKAELGMKKTQEETGIIMLEPQSRAMLEGITALHAQVAVKEAQVQAMRSFATDENPDLKRAESELAAMRSELSRLEAGKVGDSIADIDLRKVPEKGLAYVRALRELKYREAVYEAMTKQFEIARVDEAKDSAIIQVLDKAVAPEIRTSPKRALIVGSATFVGLFFAIGIALLIERGRQQRHYAARMEILKARLLAPLRSRSARA
jgi:uncharacterized protein involved in exopolysaccharide biosynthesis